MPKGKQAVFDAVAKHCLKQGVPAKAGGVCSYVTDDGKKCAVGSLLTKSELEALRRNGGLRKPFWILDDAFQAKILKRLDVSYLLISYLQDAHDYDLELGVDAYIAGMKEIARKHKLKATVLNSAAKAAV